MASISSSIKSAVSKVKSAIAPKKTTAQKINDIAKSSPAQRSVLPSSKSTIPQVSVKPVTKSVMPKNTASSSLNFSANKSTPILSSSLSSKTANSTSSTKSSSSKSKGSSNIAGAFGAISNILGGGSSNASGDKSTLSSSSMSPINFKGNSGNETVTGSGYNYKSGLSLEGKAKQEMDAAMERATATDRANRRNLIASESAAREANVGGLQQQKAAIEASLSSYAQPRQNETEASAYSTDAAGISEAPAEDAEYTTLQKQLRAIEKEIAKSMKPSAEELEAMKLEDELTAKEAAINAQVREESAQAGSQPVAQGFVSGWQKGLAEKGNSALQTIAAQKIPLVQRIAQAQMRRKQAEEAARFSYSNASGNLDRYDAKKKEAKADSRYEQERADKKENDRYMTLSDGVTLYDKLTGKIVAENAKNFAPKYAPTTPKKKITTTTTPATTSTSVKNPYLK